MMNFISVTTPQFILHRMYMFSTEKSPFTAYFKEIHYPLKGMQLFVRFVIFYSTFADVRIRSKDTQVIKQLDNGLDMLSEKCQKCAS